MKNLLQALSLSAAMLLASCSQDKGGEVLNTSIAKPVNVNLSIEADLEDDALRSSLRSLSATFSKENNWRPEIAELVPGQTVPLNLVFTDGTTMSHHQSIPFTVTQEGKLQYKGDIAVPGYNTTSKWYVTAIYGGAFQGDLNSSNAHYGYAPQMYKVGDKQQFVIGTDAGGLNIPYMSGWTPVEGAINPQDNAAEGYFKVRLRPIGYLLRIQVENRRDHKLAIKRFEPATEGFYLNANFSLSTNAEALKNGAYPTPVERPNYNGNEGNGRFVEGGAGIELERGDKTATKSEAFLVWIMPKDKITKKTTVKLNAIHYKQGAGWKFPFNLTLTPEAEAGLGGLSGLKTLIVPNDHKIYRPLYTMDYVALGNLNASGTELAPTTTGALFVLERTTNADNKKYPVYNNPRPTTESLMTVTNWENVLPRSNPETNTHWEYNGAVSRDGETFFRTSGNLTRSNDNFQFSGNTTYAIRTVDGHRAAFRYTLTPSTGTIKVDMVHLGTTSGKTISDIASSNYWELADSFGEVVTRTFAGEGTITRYLGVYDKGESARLKTDGSLGSTTWNSGTARIGMGIDIGTITFKEGHRLGRQVRQIHTKPLDIPAK